MVTGPETSNTRRSPLCGNLPERMDVMTPSASGSLESSEDFDRSTTTRRGVSSRKALCLAGPDRSSTTRVPVSVLAMRTSRISAATRFPETPATNASSASQTPVLFPKKPFPIMEFNA